MSVLQHLALSSPLSYLAAFLIPMLDAILPVLPSETIVIALGVSTAGSTDPRIALLVALAACGAFAGDNLCYFIGRRFGPLAERKVFAGEKGARRRAWATGALDRFGARLIIVCRFIPGGRTAVTLTCGIVGYSRRTFLIATALAGVIWACYAFFLGRLGGQAFEDRPWIGFLLAFGIALAASAVIELVRRIQPWRWFRRDQPASPPGPGRPAADQAEDVGATRTNKSG
jgi:membrane-associated protein